jgi:hypothetical protein
MAVTINASTSAGLVQTADTSGVLQLQTAGTTVATINAYGIGLGTGAPSSGIGITFPATQSPSADANTLDDYEEGTWTPNQGGGLTVTGSFSSNGSYVKIGRAVTVRGFVGGSTSISCAAGSVISSNIPFASPNDSAGGYFNGNLTQGGTVDISGATLYVVGAISSTAGIYFNMTYIIS